MARLFESCRPLHTCKYLLEFKAGKMQLNGNMLNPINKKGLIYLHKADDNLMHFCWKDRQTGTVEDDLIIFPDDVEFKKVEQCTTGRVYVLKFKSSTRRCFYWMQEPLETRDQEFCIKVNVYLNNTAINTGKTAASSVPSVPDANSPDISNLPEKDLQNLIQNFNAQDLMQLISHVNCSSGVLASILQQSRNRHSTGNTLTSSSSSSQTNNTPSNCSSSKSSAPKTETSKNSTSTDTAASSSGIQLSDLQNIISGLSVNQNKDEEVNVSLASALNSEALKTLLNNKEFMDKVKEFLPNTDSSIQRPLSDQISSTIESPQFKSSLNTFSSALQSGLLGPLMQQFNLSEACIEAANKGDLEGFVVAMECSEVSKKNSTEDKKESDSDMALD